MLKRLILTIVATMFFAFQLNIGSAAALDVDENIRTVKLNSQGEEIVLTNEQVKLGARLFNSTCTQCHLQGKTKTNPNVGLGLDELAGAEPPRDNIVSLVNYLQHPTTYDGEVELSLIHPNTERSDVHPEMRSFTEDDLSAIAGHLLIQPKLDPRWGGTIYN